LSSGSQVETIETLGASSITKSKRLHAGPPQALTDDPVERAVAEIRHLSRLAAVELTLNIGEIVFHRIYEADSEALRMRGPKDVSFRRLANHPELPVSAASLWRSVAIYEMSQRIPGVARLPHLGVSHLRAVIGIDPNEQRKLLQAASTNAWSVARLSQHVAEQRRGRGGRPRKPPILRAIQSLRAVADFPETAFTEPTDASEFGDEEREVVQETILRVRERCDLLERAIAKRDRTRHARSSRR